MLIITKDLIPYKVASYTDNFVVVHTGHYFKTYKKDEIELVFAGVDEEVPEVLMNKNVFDNKERDTYGTKYNRES